MAALDQAEALAAATRDARPAPTTLQAAIAACHARARTAAETDWPRIAALYAALAESSRSPVVELNRGVAVGMAFGPAAGLAIVEALASERSLANYHLLPGVRGDLLSKLGRAEEARAEFERAASLTRNAREREVLLGRAAENASRKTKQAEKSDAGALFGSFGDFARQAAPQRRARHPRDRPARQARRR